MTNDVKYRTKIVNGKTQIFVHKNDLQKDGRNINSFKYGMARHVPNPDYAKADALNLQMVAAMRELDTEKTV